MYLASATMPELRDDPSVLAVANVLGQRHERRALGGREAVQLLDGLRDERLCRGSALLNAQQPARACVGCARACAGVWRMRARVALLFSMPSLRACACGVRVRVRACMRVRAWQRCTRPA